MPVMMRFQVPSRAQSLNHKPIPQVNSLASKLIDGKIEREDHLCRKELNIAKSLHRLDEQTAKKVLIMFFQHSSDFLAQESRRITLMGMSNVGKTTLSSILPKNKWFHYSIDYRLATVHLRNRMIGKGACHLSVLRRGC